MQITRLRPDSNVDQLANALADISPRSRAPFLNELDRYAILSTQSKEQTHHFLVETSKSDKGWELLKAGGCGAEATLVAKEANGSASELTGRVECLVAGRNRSAWTASYVTRVFGFGASLALGSMTAAYGLAGTLQMGAGSTPQTVFAVMGLLTAVTALLNFPRLVDETNRDWALATLRAQRDGGGVEASLKRVENGERIKPIAALPPPSEAPCVAPPGLVKARVPL